MGRRKRTTPRVWVRGIIPEGHPLNSILAGETPAQALGTLLDRAVDNERSRQIVPLGHPLNAVMAGMTGFDVVPALLELALDGFRARQIVPDGHPLTGAMAGKKGLDAVAALLDLALEGLRARERAPVGGETQICGAHSGPSQTDPAPGVNPTRQPIPKALLNFRKRSRIDQTTSVPAVHALTPPVE